MKLELSNVFRPQMGGRLGEVACELGHTLHIALDGLGRIVA